VATKEESQGVKEIDNKFDIKKFSRENNFGLWRLKMEVIFFQ